MLEKKQNLNRRKKVHNYVIILYNYCFLFIKAWGINIDEDR